MSPVVPSTSWFGVNPPSAAGGAVTPANFRPSTSGSDGFDATAGVRSAPFTWSGVQLG